MTAFFFAQIRMHKYTPPHGDYNHTGEAINNFKVKKVTLN